MHLCGIFDLVSMVLHGRLMHRSRGLTDFWGRLSGWFRGFLGQGPLRHRGRSGLPSAGLQPAVCAPGAKLGLRPRLR
jgi:hypothetical protein